MRFCQDIPPLICPSLLPVFWRKRRFLLFNPSNPRRFPAKKEQKLPPAGAFSLPPVIGCRLYFPSRMENKTGSPPADDSGRWQIKFHGCHPLQRSHRSPTHWPGCWAAAARRGCPDSPHCTAVQSHGIQWQFFSPGCPVRSAGQLP